MKLFLTWLLVFSASAVLAVTQKTEKLWGRVKSTDQAQSEFIVEARVSPDTPTTETLTCKIGAGDAYIGWAGRQIRFERVVVDGISWAQAIFPADPELVRQMAEVTESLHRETLDKGRIVTRLPSELMPNMALWDQEGRLVTKKDVLGSPIALNFIFTSCRSARMCPASTACMKQLGDLLDKSDPKKVVRLLTITFDPETDSPGILHTYANGYGINHARHRFLTGDAVQIKDLMRHYGIQTLREDGTIVHNAALLLLTPEGRIWQRREGASFDAEDVAKTLTNLPR